MRLRIVFVLTAVAMFVIVESGGTVNSDELKLAPDGLHVRPLPAESAPTFGGAPQLHPFTQDPSGAISRTIFETSEDPNFNLIVRDFGFPPDKKPYTITLPSGGILHIPRGKGEIKIADKQMALTKSARTTVPAGTAFAFTNNGDRALFVRAIIVQAK